MHQINIHEAKTNLSKLVKKVINGEEIIIAKDNKPVVRMIKYDKTKPKRKIGTAKGKIRITADFDAPLKDFKNYTK